MLGIATLPFVGRLLGESYPFVALVIAVSLVLVVLAATLLWAQARVTHSAPLLVLATAYAGTAALMLPYLVLHRGLWPEIGLRLGANPQSSPWLWFAWHLLFVMTPLAYVGARRRAANLDDVAFRRLQRVLAVGMTTFVVCTGAAAIWLKALPQFYAYGAWTLTAQLCVTFILVFSAASIVALYAFDRFRSALDMWLVVASLCMFFDVVLSLRGAAAFSLGWYVTRVFIVIATGSVLTALLLQTASVYAQLALAADRFRDASLTDTLTGLANRRSFDERLAYVWADATRMKRGVALLMIDVDNFKLFNDAFGHPRGDDCLRTIATAARDAVNRTRDLVARIGGEEFAVIMAETDLEGALTVAERIRGAVEELGVPHAVDAAHRVVSVSIGATAIADTSAMRLEAAIERADRALYAAKAAGRNRVYADADGTRNTRETEAGSRATIS